MKYNITNCEHQYVQNYEVDTVIKNMFQVLQFYKS